MAKKQGMIAGFKEFISRGNVVDLAVGVVIGAAFSAIVKALVDGVLMPIIAGIFGKPNFDNVGAFVINGSTVKPGLVITALVNFLLVALGVYFLFVVPINRLRQIELEWTKQQDAAAAEEAPAVEPNVQLLTEIRDLLAAGAPARPTPAGDAATTPGAAPTERA